MQSGPISQTQAIQIDDSGRATFKTGKLPDDLSSLTKDQLDLIYAQTLSNYSAINESHLKTPQFDQIKESGINTVSSLRRDVGGYRDLEQEKANQNVHLISNPPPESREHLWRQAPVVGSKLGLQDEVFVSGSVNLGRGYGTGGIRQVSGTEEFQNQNHESKIGRLGLAGQEERKKTRQTHGRFEEEEADIEYFQKFERSFEQSEVDFKTSGDSKFKTLQNNNLGLTLPSVGLSHISHASSHDFSLGTGISGQQKPKQSTHQTNVKARQQALNAIQKNNNLDFGADESDETHHNASEDNGKVLRFNPKTIKAPKDGLASAPKKPAIKTGTEKNSSQSVKANISQGKSGAKERESKEDGKVSASKGTQGSKKIRFQI